MKTLDSQKLAVKLSPPCRPSRWALRKELNPDPTMAHQKKRMRLVISCFVLTLRWRPLEKGGN